MSKSWINKRNNPKTADSGIDEPYHGKGIAPDERMTSYELTWPVDHEHGHPDHEGLRCAECALMSPNACIIHPSSGDYWQDLQIKWQEQCDVIFRRFDDAVAAHFPDHQPQGCMSCPPKPILPVKPTMPFERALEQ